MMESFRVWTRPLGSACRIQVDGISNGKWLRARILDAARGTSCLSILPEDPSGLYKFLVIHTPVMTTADLTTLLANTPEVNLMRDPC